MRRRARGAPRLPRGRRAGGTRGGGARRGNWQSGGSRFERGDQDYVEDGEARKWSSGESEEEDEEPTEVSGWRRLDESPSFLTHREFKLRSYQLDGLNWLRASYYMGRNVILGDEMGLGKTAQARHA